MAETAVAAQTGEGIHNTPMVETPGDMWARVHALLAASAYVHEGEFEFEQQDGRVWMHFHGPVPECVHVMQVAADWVRTGTQCPSVWSKLVADKAGSQVTVCSQDVAAVGALFCAVHAWHTGSGQ